MFSYFFSFILTAIPSSPVLRSHSVSAIWSYSGSVLWFIGPIYPANLNTLPGMWVLLSPSDCCKLHRYIPCFTGKFGTETHTSNRLLSHSLYISSFAEQQKISFYTKIQLERETSFGRKEFKTCFSVVTDIQTSFSLSLSRFIITYNVSVHHRILRGLSTLARWDMGDNMTSMEANCVENYTGRICRTVFISDIWV